MDLPLIVIISITPLKSSNNEYKLCYKNVSIGNGWTSACVHVTLLSCTFDVLKQVSNSSFVDLIDK